MPDDPTMSHSSLDAVIAAYMQTVDSGAVPNREESLEQYRNLAESLRLHHAAETTLPSTPTFRAGTVNEPPLGSTVTSKPRCQATSLE
jgi:hypothetical protein